MVEVVSERGYEATTVRELAGAAGVSTRTFYQHYSSKEECFLQVHQLLVRRVLGRLGASRIGVSDRKARLLLGVDAIVQEWGRNPRAAHLVLIDSYSAGPAALKQARQASHSIKVSMTDTHVDPSEDTPNPPLVMDGIVAGLINVMRSELLSDEKRTSVDELSPALVRWALTYCDPLAAQLDKLDRVHGSKYLVGQSAVLAPAGDVGALLSAAAKLAADKEYRRITPRDIFAAAGVPRRSFYKNFSDADDCLAAALELYAGNAIAHAKRASAKGLTSAGGVYRGVRALCIQVAQDPVFAGLCFDENSSDGVAKLRCHQRLMASIAGLVEDAFGIEEIATKASLGALWGVLQDEVTVGRARKALDLAGALAYLMLAPIVGAPTAVEAIRQECALGEQRTIGR